MNCSVNDFKKAAVTVNSFAIDDDNDLDKAIEVLECVIAFVKERGDCNCLAWQMRMELDRLDGFKSARKQRK
jgi:hypothetical protein